MLDTISVPSLCHQNIPMLVNKVSPKKTRYVLVLIGFLSATEESTIT